MTSRRASVQFPLRGIRHCIGLVQVMLRWVLLHCLPSLAVVEFHPVVLAVLQLTRALQGLCEEISEVVVVGRVFEAEVPHVRQVFIELLCIIMSVAVAFAFALTHAFRWAVFGGVTHREIDRTGP